MAQRLKVLLLIPHLGGGGAEQVVALLARGLSSEKYELHLALITQAAAGPETLPQSVVLHLLGASRVRTGAFSLLRLVRQLKPDVILSVMVQLNFLVLLLRLLFPRRTNVLVRQNETASAAMAVGDQPCYMRLLYKLLYRRADGIICQTRSMAQDLVSELGIPKELMSVLPNPVDLADIRHTITEEPHPWTGPGPHFLTVGRLAPVKGFDLLLRALVTVRKRFPTADLTFVGAGKEEFALKALCRELELEPYVSFEGHSDRPASFFSGATLFVLASRHEGLPNAMLEAAAGGLPIVAMPASGGVTDLLRGQPGTWLAPEISADALATCLLAALETLRPGERFAHPFVEQFRMERVLDAYEELIDASAMERKQ
jgi:glycosyltransferase involved in cell wall biosynthesis